MEIIERRCNMIFHFPGHVTPWASASASSDANDIINDTIAFLRSRQPKWSTTIFLGHVMALVPGKHQCHIMSMAPLHFLGQDNQNELQHDLFVHVMPLALASASSYADGVINGILSSLRSRWLKWFATWPFLVMWCHWHQNWCHMILMALSMAHSIP